MRPWIVLIALAACGDPDVDPCVEAPVVTWETFGQGFVTERCQSCHATTAPERPGVPDGVHFDTEEQVRAISERVLQVATGDEPSMPPQGGVEAEDRERLRIWLTCW